MLVLTQKVGEAVLVGDDISVRILSIDNGQVRVGYVAPKNINIVRETLKQKLEDAGIVVSGTKDGISRPRYREAK